MNREILRRLILAKTFMKGAQGFAYKPYDENSMAVAVVQLHDAVDNLLGAVASEKNITLNPSSYMNQSYAAIKLGGVDLTHSTQINSLNTLRNNIKHQGLVPNREDLISLLPAVINFCEATCESVFGVPLSGISRITLVENEGVRSELENIEKLIEAQEYKQAMGDAAVVMHKRFNNTHLMVWRLNTVIAGAQGGATKYDQTFPNGVARDLNIDLLEIGLDPYLYYRFSNLTPEVGQEIGSDKIVLKKSGEYWHEDNWTEENALFCLNFLTDALVSQQRKYGGYSIKSWMRRHKITFAKDSQAVDYMKKPYKLYKAKETLECQLLSYAENDFQPNRHSEDNLTDLIITNDEGKHEIILISPKDIEKIEEEHTVKSLDI